MKTISRYLMALLAIAFFQKNILHAQSGNVGVNQDNPASVLDVNGNLSIGATYSGTSNAPTNGAIIEGNVGIGTYNPQKKLHLSGGGDVELMIESTSTTGKKWSLQSNAINPAVKTSFQIIDRTAGASRLGIDTLGRVGIGTVTPLSKLAVNGNLAIGSNYSGTIAAPTNGAIIEGNVGIGITSPLAKLHSWSNNGLPGSFESDYPTGSFLSLGNASTGGKWFQLISTGSNLGADAGKLLFSSGPQSYQASTIMMTLDPETSHIGIGTSSPANKLDVEGGIAIGENYSGTSTAPTNGAIIEGRVGIGTVNPSSNLQVSSATGATPIAYFTAPDNWGEIRVGCNNKFVDLGSNESGYGYIGTKSPADLFLRTNDGVKLAIQDSTGNVGIGTTTPVNKLDVEGGLAIGGTYSGISAAPTDGAIIEGNVGIGTNSTSAKLHVKSSSLDIAKMEGSSPFGSWLVIGNTPNSNWFQMIATGDQNGYGTDKLVFGGGTSPYAPSGIIMTLDRTTRNVGIGTTSPQAPLHVTGASGVNSGTDIKYFNYTATNITSASNWQGQTAILANGNICATAAFIAGASFNFSDARIKNIIGRSDGAEDLARLNQIEITRYTHIDTISKGNAVQTKVIAQQLETVMPEAVSYTREFIPDVMQVAERIDFQENTLTANLSKPHSLKVGDHVKCIDEKGQELFVDVLAAPNENSVVFKTDQNPSKLFIYGKQVDDFHIVDYDAIAMLNVSATQELAKRLAASQQSIEQLQAEVAALKSQLLEMEVLKKQVAQLAAAMQSPDFTTQNANENYQPYSAPCCLPTLTFSQLKNDGGRYSKGSCRGTARSGNPFNRHGGVALPPQNPMWKFDKN
ncbi:MAG: hypothetical protein GC192_14895 [Bacteroidetes bacterium]|nr:hypothetical protein [Bacteroidota bacterium]